MDISSFSCIPIAFLLGSVPSAYIVAKLSAKVGFGQDPSFSFQELHNSTESICYTYRQHHYGGNNTKLVADVINCV